jgi:hypothetical protein
VSYRASGNTHEITACVPLKNTSAGLKHSWHGSLLSVCWYWGEGGLPLCICRMVYAMMTQVVGDPYLYTSLARLNMLSVSNCSNNSRHASAL